MNILGQKTLTATPPGDKVWEERVVVPAKMFLKLSNQTRGADTEVEDLFQF